MQTITHTHLLDLLSPNNTHTNKEQAFHPLSLSRSSLQTHTPHFFPLPLE
ncbi:hypothetical protein Hanom_Chr09g00799471 [Helianthus anomalus]